MSARPSVGKEDDRLFYQGICKRCGMALYGYEDKPREACNAACGGKKQKPQKAAA